jgi:hypothetical protein
MGKIIKIEPLDIHEQDEIADSNRRPAWLDTSETVEITLADFIDNLLQSSALLIVSNPSDTPVGTEPNDSVCLLLLPHGSIDESIASANSNPEYNETNFEQTIKNSYTLH